VVGGNLCKGMRNKKRSLTTASSGQAPFRETSLTVKRFTFNDQTAVIAVTKELIDLSD